jgi:hypothetical protein
LTQEDEQEPVSSQSSDEDAKSPSFIADNGEDDNVDDNEQEEDSKAEEKKTEDESEYTNTGADKDYLLLETMETTFCKFKN